MSLRRLTSALCIALAFSLSATLPLRAEGVLVFAASSLKTALDEVAQGFEAATGNHATISYAGSSQLARHIEMGAPADVFLSANEAWMDQLENEGKIAPGSRRDLLGNRLVLIAAQGAPLPLAQLPQALGENGHLAMALVDAVPAGIYGKAALENLGLWQALAPKVAQTDSARAALALVASGEAPFGVVYATDAQAEPRVVRVATFPQSSHPPVVYPIAAIAGHDGPLSRAFLDWLAAPAARAIFTANGFTLPADERAQ